MDLSFAAGEDHTAHKILTRFLTYSEILFYKESLQTAQPLQLQLQCCLAEDRHTNSMSRAAVREARGSLPTLPCGPWWSGLGAGRLALPPGYQAVQQQQSMRKPFPALPSLSLPSFPRLVSAGTPQGVSAGSGGQQEEACLENNPFPKGRAPANLLAGHCPFLLAVLSRQNPPAESCSPGRKLEIIRKSSLATESEVWSMNSYVLTLCPYPPHTCSL